MVMLNDQTTLTGRLLRGRPGALKDLLTLYLLDFPDKETHQTFLLTLIHLV